MYRAILSPTDYSELAVIGDKITFVKDMLHHKTSHHVPVYLHVVDTKAPINKGDTGVNSKGVTYIHTGQTVPEKDDKKVVATTAPYLHKYGISSISDKFLKMFAELQGRGEIKMETYPESWYKNGYNDGKSSNHNDNEDEEDDLVGAICRKRFDEHRIAGNAVLDIVPGEQNIQEAMTTMLIEHAKEVVPMEVSGVAHTFDMPKISRVEVICMGKGRDYVNMNTGNVDISIQDDGRTLKIFVEKLRN